VKNIRKPKTGDAVICRELRLKMELSITAILAFVLFLIFGAINLYFHLFYNNQTSEVLTRLLNNDGHRIPLSMPFPPAGGPHAQPGDEVIPFFPDDILPPKVNTSDAMGSGKDPLGRWFGIQPFFPHDKFDLYDYFSLVIDEKGKKLLVVSDYRLRYNDETFSPIVSGAYKGYLEGKTEGVYNGIRWKMKKTDSGYFIACINMQNTVAMQISLLRLTTILYAVCVLISFLLALLFSGWAIAPVKETLIEQKQFIADAGHELKTPIAVIGANVDVLMAAIPDNKWLQYIKTENERLSLLVKDLLYLAHSDSGRTNLTKTDFNLAEMAESVVLPFESIVYEQGKKLEIDIPETIHIRADETRLKEVVIVLVDNALKNTDKGAVIKVSVYQVGSQRFIKVYNTGKGILPEELEKIFLRFYRSDASRARNTGGSGLGLSIAQSIVLNHGGTIKAESEYGKWAEFTVRLPER
jgi:signal transduction histidine kinase